MIKNLISFGCSWPHGTELIDPVLEEQNVQPCDTVNDPYRISRSYPGLIAAHFKWYLSSCTRTKTTNLTMLKDFEIWLQSSTKAGIAESLVLIGLTHETATATEQEDAAFEHAVAEFDRLAVENDVNMLQFNVLARQHRLKYSTLIESSSALEMLVIRDKPRKDPLFTEHKFPNEKGHAIISEFLINTINSVILNE